MKVPAKHRDILKIIAYSKTPKICNWTAKQNYFNLRHTFFESF